MKTIALLVSSLMLVVAPPPPAAEPDVTVVLVPKLPEPSAPAAILRRGAPRADVILLAHGEATAENLAAALALLADVRARDGDVVSRDAVMVLKSSRLDRPLPVGQRVRLEAHLARLRAARPRPVEGVGTVPAIEVNVRPRAGRR